MSRSEAGCTVFLLFVIIASCRRLGDRDPSDTLCQDPGIPPDSCIEYKYKNNKFEVNSTWIFRCTWGFPRHGMRQIVCQPNGQWSAQIPSCVKGSGRGDSFCPHPLGENKNVYEVGWNFTIEGKIVTCMDDGKWAGHVSHCKSEYYRHLNENDGVFCPNILGEGECSPVGETVSVGNCGEADKPFTCGKHGKWIGKIPTCDGPQYQWLKWQFPSGVTYFNRINGDNTGVSPAFAESSPVGTFPWQAALAARVNNSRPESYNDWFIYCSGVLVSDKWVLTAAHCLTEKRSKLLRSLRDTVVYLGKHFRDNEMDDEHVKQIGIKRMIIHPEYEPTLLSDDIGLIELDVLIDFSERIRPICLPQLGSYSPLISLQSERYAVTAGWGINHLNQPNEELGHVLVKFANISDCLPIPNVKRSLFFCGKPYDDDNGWPCPGDSGGPLIFQEFLNGYYRYVVEGLVSQGDEVCTTTKTAFIKVRPYLCWIKEIIRNELLMDDSRDPKVRFTCVYQSYGPETQEEYEKQSQGWDRTG